ncbi:hypothetical protein CWI85_28000 [Streptomyces albidoflavus]|nr:hypothetical protein CWI85_28000 [Streptomyces albidoflavus]
MVMGPAGSGRASSGLGSGSAEGFSGSGSGSVRIRDPPSGSGSGSGSSPGPRAGRSMAVGSSMGRRRHSSALFSCRASSMSKSTPTLARRKSPSMARRRIFISCWACSKTSPRSILARASCSSSVRAAGSRMSARASIQMTLAPRGRKGPTTAMGTLSRLAPCQARKTATATMATTPMTGTTQRRPATLTPRASATMTLPQMTSAPMATVRPMAPAPRRSTSDQDVQARLPRDRAAAGMRSGVLIRRRVFIGPSRRGRRGRRR